MQHGGCSRPNATAQGPVGVFQCLRLGGKQYLLERGQRQRRGSHNLRGSNPPPIASALTAASIGLSSPWLVSIGSPSTAAFRPHPAKNRPLPLIIATRSSDTIRRRRNTTCSNWLVATLVALALRRSNVIINTSLAIAIRTTSSELP